MSYRMLYYAAEIWICYLAIFYIIMPLAMTKREVIANLVVSAFWAVGLFIIIIYADTKVKTTIGNVWESGYLLATCYWFVQGSVCRNMVVVYALFEIINVDIYAFASFVDPAFGSVLLEPIVEEARMRDFIGVYVCVILSAFLLRPLVAWFLRKTEGHEAIFRWMLAVIIMAAVIGIITQKGKYFYAYDAYGWFYVRTLFVIWMGGVVVVFVLWLKGNAMKRRSLALRRELILLEQRYENVIEKNRELSELRHEINRHMQAVREIHSFVPSGQALAYAEAIEKKNAAFLELSLSGNLYVDFMIEQIYQEFREQGIVFETVLEPLKLSEMQTLELMDIMEELFGYVKMHVRSKRWVRLSIRTHGKMLLCQLENGYDDPKEYYRQRALNYLGSGLYLRQRLAMTGQLVRERNGMELHRLEQRYMVFAVLLPYCGSSDAA